MTDSKNRKGGEGSGSSGAIPNWLLAAGGAALAVGGAVALKKYMNSGGGYSAALSSEIEQFFHENRQSDDTKSKKEQLKGDLMAIIRTVYHGSELYIVGSSANGFGFDDSDLDLCLMISMQEMKRRGSPLNVLRCVKDLLCSHRFIGMCMLIPANVPILRFCDDESGIKCDLNVNNVEGLYNTHLLAMYARVDSRLTPLGMFVKHWAQNMDIHGADRGRLSTYALLLMLIHFLQCGCSPPVLPNLQARFPKEFSSNRQADEVDMELELPWHKLQSANRSTLGELFTGFTAYYAGFDFNQTISICSGGPSHRCTSMIEVQEPFKGHNVAKTVSDKAVFAEIREAFRRTNEALRREEPLQSVWKKSPSSSPEPSSPCRKDNFCANNKEDSSIHSDVVAQVINENPLLGNIRQAFKHADEIVRSLDGQKSLLEDWSSPPASSSTFNKGSPSENKDDGCLLM